MSKRYWWEKIQLPIFNLFKIICCFLGRAIWSYLAIVGNVFFKWLFSILSQSSFHLLKIRPFMKFFRSKWFIIMKSRLRNNHLIAIPHPNKNYIMMSQKYSLSRNINEYADKLDYFCGSLSSFKLNSRKYLM